MQIVIRLPGTVYQVWQESPPWD